MIANPNIRILRKPDPSGRSLIVGIESPVRGSGLRTWSPSAESSSDLALLTEIRAARPDAPVILMTAHGSPEDARQAMALGVTRFVGKPFDVSEMVRLVGDAWVRRAATA